MISFGRPFRTKIILALNPSTEVLGYCQMSLRDNGGLVRLHRCRGILQLPLTGVTDEGVLISDTSNCHL